MKKLNKTKELKKMIKLVAGLKKTILLISMEQAQLRKENADLRRKNAELRQRIDELQSE